MRITWVDNARAIGILLVLIGHSTCLRGFPSNLIYSFHMPLFFFMSGFLLKQESLRIPLPQFLGKSIRTLLVPYAAFGLLSCLYWLLSNPHGSSAAEYAGTAWHEPLVGMLYGNCETLHANQVLWFFTTLFTTGLYFYLLARLLGAPALLAAVIMLGIAGPLYRVGVWKRPPWNTDLATVSMVFYGLGHMLRASGRLIRGEPKVTVPRLLGAAGLAAVLLWTVRRNGWADMSKMRFGADVWLFYLAAFAGIALVVVSARMVPASRAARWLADNTIVIFPLQPILYSLFTGIGVKLFHQPFTFRDHWLFCVLYVAGALLLCIPISYALRRWAPIAIAVRR